MSIFSRVRDIVNSKFNAALDKADNPEKLLRQMTFPLFWCQGK